MMYNHVNIWTTKMGDDDYDDGGDDVDDDNNDDDDDDVVADISSWSPKSEWSHWTHIPYISKTIRREMLSNY